VDRGGTFTDVVIFRQDGSVDVKKVPSDQAIIGLLVEGRCTVGSTVATNALLEGRFAPTLLLTRRGCGDLLEIGDMRRPSLFDPWHPPPRPLAARVVEIEDSWPDGLELEGFRSAVVAFPGPDPEAERRWAAEAVARAPWLYAVCASEVDPAVGFLARVQTALVDAAITPWLREAADHDRLPPDTRMVRSDGTLCPLDRWRAPDAVLSGPSTGPLGVAHIARLLGFEQAVGLDMGGTSTDICHVDLGPLPTRTGVTVAGYPVRRRAAAVETIAAGGGSVVSTEAGWLRVGPASAGADPGPQCYGRGGPPTVTDAALALGFVDPRAFDPPLRVERVHLPAAASAVVDLAQEAMAAAIRRTAAARGADPALAPLVGFGGAAGQHAAWVAEKAGIRTVLFHPLASVFCAWAQSLAVTEESTFQAYWVPIERVDLDAERQRLQERLPGVTSFSAELDVRLVGTEDTLTVPWSSDPQAVIQAFHRAHLAVYGFDRPGVVELVHLRVRGVHEPAEPPRDLSSLDPWQLADGVVIGPTTLRSPTTTVAVPAGWTARRVCGILRLDRQEPPPSLVNGPELWGLRLQGAAEEGGEVLRRLARSVNIRERLDFSCAIFDPAGRLVANAPHVPVHLGAMGDTVRDILAYENDFLDETSWLTNDPAAGGSHLPDLTVVTAVHHDGEVFFVASRAHHADVGGITPGSMPPFARTLAEEGLVFRRVRLVRNGRWEPGLEERIAGSRLPEVLAEDLAAQVAANRKIAAAIRRLGSARDLIEAMNMLRQHVSTAVAHALGRCAPGFAEDDVDGVPICLSLRREATWILDFSGTGPPHRGNLNTPPAVVRAACLYALRLLCAVDLPLNEGALDPVTIKIPGPSIFAPPPGSAVAGGNVETSQRIVDLVLRAAGVCAASAGTMANLTWGGRGWTYYETLGGGCGGSARGPGLSARQVHMTNTRLTDAEVLAHRTPLRVVETSVRRGSGGSGLHRGGDGLCREIETTEEAEVSLLAAFRPRGAPGLDGGGSGAPGEAWIRQDGQWAPWDGRTKRLNPGDRVRILTPGGGGWRAP
jgi:5-oxoprolinase (ATP-hydrolysing)